MPGRRRQNSANRRINATLVLSVAVEVGLCVQQWGHISHFCPSPANSQYLLRADTWVRLDRGGSGSAQCMARTGPVVNVAVYNGPRVLLDGGRLSVALWQLDFRHQLAADDPQGLLQFAAFFLGKPLADPAHHLLHVRGADVIIVHISLRDL